MKTLKIKHLKKRSNRRSRRIRAHRPKCIAILQSNTNKVKGEVEFIQKSNNVLIKYIIHNLDNGNHGFHIHKFGDIRDGCTSAGPHFNPFNRAHGGLDDINSHAGDLGNVYSNNKLCKGTIKTNKISLLNNKRNVIGRTLVIHANVDDCGMGSNHESSKTGNAGSRLACGVIGLSK
jgi:superoxide dismutase, Cu-Zn family